MKTEENLDENTEKYKTFPVSIKKEIIKKDKNGNDKIMKISYKIKFIDSFRLMSRSLSSLVDNLSEGLHGDKCIDCKSCLDYMITKDDQLIFKCFECKKHYKKEFSKEVIKRFNECCNRDIPKFILLLRKGFYPYKCMNSWGRFDETSLSNKEALYSSLNMENITDVVHRHTNNASKKFKLKHVGEYHDLYVQSDTILLADVFENFRSKCIEIYDLDPAHFLSPPGFAWQACLKKTEV